MNNSITVDVKAYNRNRIFRYIYEKGEVSKQQLLETLELSLPTIHQNLKELLSEELIVIDGSFESTGGRKAKIYKINRDRAVSVSVNIKQGTTDIRLINLAAQIIYESSLAADIRSESYSQLLKEHIATALTNATSPDTLILGAGITIPGILADDNHVIANAPTLGIRDMSIDNIVRSLDIPYIVMNDAKAESFAQSWFDGDTQDMSIYLMLGDGVGGDVRGINVKKHNKQGEIGHMTLHPGGRECFCGKKGCFESYVARRCLSDDYNMTLDEFFDKLRGQDSTAYKIFESYTDDLTTGINNLYSISDSDIIVGGVMAGYLKEYEDMIRGKLIDRCSFETDGSYLRFTDLSEKQSSIGAAIYFIAEYIEGV